MKLTPGTIYFVREAGSAKGSLSNLVKIGLVEGERSPFERLREHQTGNPRRLEFDEKQFVKTDAVAYVEAQLHNVFAERRVSGEWFDFPTEELVYSAVEMARGFAAQIAELNPVIAKAEELYWSYSKAQKLAPSEETLLLGQRHARAVVLSKAFNELISEIRASMIFIGEIEGREAIKAYFREVEYFSNPKFARGRFQKSSKEHKALYAAYQYQEPEWKPKFDNLVNASSDSEVIQALELVAEMRDDALIFSKARDVESLNELDLKARVQKASYDWELDFTEAHLKVACGENEGIEAICSWVREESLSNKKFNEGKFQLDYPDLYSEFIDPGSKAIRKIRMPLKA